jgi:hypothetical protein
VRLVGLGLRCQLVSLAVQYSYAWLTLIIWFDFELRQEQRAAEKKKMDHG